MSTLLQTDVRAYRICILYEALHKKPIEEAYKHMKAVKPNIDFPDFEYWYYRFLSGDHDLDHDRNTDPKTRTFSDMPIDVAERIVGELDVLDRLSLRKVSRNLRSIVDIQKTKCESISIEFSRNTSNLKFEDATINYRFAEEGLCTIRSERNYQYRQVVKTTKEKLNGVHWELAINDLSSFLINPNWRFEKIGINFNSKNNQKEEDDAKPLCLLKSMLSSTRIHVEEINIISTTLAPAVTLLPYFRPNSLKSIKFWSDEIDKGLLEQIMETDHWKTANELHFKNIPDWFDIEKLFHAREFSIWNCDLSDDRIKTVRDVLLKSKTLEWCSLGTESNRDDSIDVDYPNLDQDLEALDEKVFEIMNKDPAYTGSRYNVEGADFYFEIKCDRWCDTTEYLLGAYRHYGAQETPQFIESENKIGGCANDVEKYGFEESTWYKAMPEDIVMDAREVEEPLRDINTIRIICFALDFTITCLVQPVPFYPLLAGYSSGILWKWFGVSFHYQLMIIVYLAVFQVLCLQICFLKKHQVIATLLNTHVLPKLIVRVGYLICIFDPFIHSLHLNFLRSSKQEQWDFIQKNYPEYLSAFRSLSNFEFYTKSLEFTDVFLLCIILATGYIIYSILLAVDVFRLMKQLQLRISMKNYQKHKEAVRSLMIQTVTILLSASPIGSLLLAVYLKMDNAQLMSELCIAWFLTHSSVNMISLMIFFPPFKQFILRVLKKYKRTETTKKTSGIFVTTL